MDQGDMTERLIEAIRNLSVDRLVALAASLGVKDEGGHDRPAISEEIVQALPSVAKGARVHYFSGARLRGLVAPGGFGIRVSGDTRSYVLNYRAGAAERRITIGRVGTWKCVDAIRRAIELRREIDKGGDPLADKRKAAMPAPKVETVGELAERFIKRHINSTAHPLRTATEMERHMRRRVIPKLGAIAVADLKKSDIRGLLDDVADEAGPVAADRLLALVSKLLRWHEDQTDESFKAPRLSGLRRTSAKERARSRVLADDEIRDVWNCSAGVTVPWCYRVFVRALLLTGQRRGEVAALLRWSRLDTSDPAAWRWTIPANEYKGKREHVVAIVPAVQALLGERPKNGEGSDYIFEVGGKPFADFARRKAMLDARIAELRQREGRPPMAGWVYHDVRRTARSLLSRAGIRHEVAERVIGHAVGDATSSVYDRHSYWTEKVDAMERLAALVQRIVNPPAEVVSDLAERRRA